MGVGYYRPVAQWSKGEYDGATNTEDDLADIAAHGLSPRTDDHGDTAFAATTLGPGGTAVVDGLIGSRTDKDLFRFGLTCTGQVTADAVVAPNSPDLDVRLRLLSGAGDVLASANPPSSMVSADLADGLSAGLSRNRTPGTYLLEVDGVGALDPVSTGYSDYASLGTYTLTVDGCLAAPPSTPQAVTVDGDADHATATIDWSPPANQGDSPVTGYQVSVDGERVRTVGAGERSAAFDLLATEVEHTLSVRAVTALGVSPLVDRTITLPRPLPGQASGVQGTPGFAQATVRWNGPSNAFAAGIDGYRVQTYLGASDTMVDQEFTDGSTFGWTQTGLTNGQPYTFDVTALHGTTMGAVSTRSTPVTPSADIAVPGPPEQVEVTQDGDDPSATITWEPPSSTGGSPITGYQINVTGDGFGANQNLNPAARTATFEDLPVNQELTFAITATTAQGTGPAAEVTLTLFGVTAPPPPTVVTGEVDDATGMATLGWEPAGDGGSPITKYVVRINGPAAETRVLGPQARTALFGPLEYGRDYTMTVRARNVVGTSLPATVIVRRELPIPEAPTGVTATPRDQAVQVAWSPPGNAEAAGVDAYRVRWFAGGEHHPARQRAGRGDAARHLGHRPDQRIAVPLRRHRAARRGRRATVAEDPRGAAVRRARRRADRHSITRCARRSDHRDGALAAADEQQRLARHRLPGDRPPVRPRRRRGRPHPVGRAARHRTSARDGAAAGGPVRLHGAGDQRGRSGCRLGPIGDRAGALTIRRLVRQQADPPSSTTVLAGMPGVTLTRGSPVWPSPPTTS